MTTDLADARRDLILAYWQYVKATYRTDNIAIWAREIRKLKPVVARVKQLKEEP